MKEKRGKEKVGRDGEDKSESREWVKRDIVDCQLIGEVLNKAREMGDWGQPWDQRQ